MLFNIINSVTDWSVKGMVLSGNSWRDHRNENILEFIYVEEILINKLFSGFLELFFYNLRM